MGNKMTSDERQLLTEIHAEVSGQKVALENKVHVRECEDHRRQCASSCALSKSRSVGWLLTAVCCIITAVSTLTASLIMPSVKSYVFPKKVVKVVNK